MSTRDDADEATEFKDVDRIAALRHQLTFTRDADDGSPKHRAAHVEAYCALIIALVDELDDDAAEIELAALWPLVAHDVRLEVEARRKIARGFVDMFERERATAMLKEAFKLARRAKLTDLETEVGIALGVVLRAQEKRDEAKSILSTTSATGAKPDIAARLELSLASVESGDDAEAHARRALELAKKVRDTPLLYETSIALAEIVAERGALEDAEALLEELPPLDDVLEKRAKLECQALLEEIWRRLGSHLEDEADEPDEPGDMDRQLRAYITKPRTFGQALIDGGLVGRDRIREWSHGELRVPADLESQRIFGPVRSFWCACGRYRGRAYKDLVCKRCGVELVHASNRRTRSGHITLAVPVVHPWYAPAAASLFGVPSVDGRPVDELRTQLREIDLEWLLDDIKKEIITAPKAKIADAAGRRMALVEAFRQARKVAYTRPEDIILDIVPVVPPHGDLGCDREKVREAYAALIEANAGDTPAAVRKLFEAFATK